MENSEKQKDFYLKKTLIFGLQISAFFAVPAIVGAIAGVKLDGFFNTGRKITAIILTASFIFSWTVVIIKYRNLGGKINRMKKERDVE